MRRTSRLALATCLCALGPIAACSDDDGSGGASSASDQISTEAVCGALDAEQVSEVMGVDFDSAVASEGTCTYTSSSSQTAFTLQVSDQGTTDAALVLTTMGASCDEGSRRDRTFRGADGGFSCLAGGVPNVVAVGHGRVLVLTGNSREAGVTPAMVADDLATVLGDALGTYGES